MCASFEDAWGGGGYVCQGCVDCISRDMCNSKDGAMKQSEDVLPRRNYAHKGASAKSVNMVCVSVCVCE
jgi:hypothetical protein